MKLSDWLSSHQTLNLGTIIKLFFDKVADWLLYPLTQKDPLSCSVKLLELIAQERGITPIDGEPLSVFRLRVHYAFINARDAGSSAGLKRILQRLGFGHVEILERQDGYDWDEIIIQVSNSQLSTNQALLDQVIKRYGRSCRRYRLSVIESIQLNQAVTHAALNNKTLVAKV